MEKQLGEGRVAARRLVAGVRNEDIQGKAEIRQIMVRVAGKGNGVGLRLRVRMRIFWGESGDKKINNG